MTSYFRTISVTIWTALIMMLLTACQLTNTKDHPQSVAKEEKLAIVEQPPKMISTDWNTILTPLIDELLQTTEVGENNQILISDVKNISNRYISSSRINSVIFNLMSQQNIFNIIDKQIVNQTKQTLGIPYDDTLVSRSKMILLARNIKADYVLFTTVNQIPQLPDTQADVLMELLLAKTGEIVWQFSSSQLVDNLSENQSGVQTTLQLEKE